MQRLSFVLIQFYPNTSESSFKKLNVPERVIINQAGHAFQVSEVDFSRHIYIGSVETLLSPENWISETILRQLLSQPGYDKRVYHAEQVYRKDNESILPLAS